MIIAIAQLQRASDARSRTIESVEKMALYYIALSPHLANARQLTEFATRALQRMPPGEGRIKYAHLFDPGDPYNKQFWLNASATHPELVDSYLITS